MSADPAFASTPNMASAVLGGFDASFTAPSTVTTLITAASAGTQIYEITVQGLGVTQAVGIVNIFIYTGSVYNLYDQFILSAVAGSTTAASFQARRAYGNLILKTGYSLRVTHTTTGNDTSKLSVTAVGADFT